MSKEKLIPEVRFKGYEAELFHERFDNFVKRVSNSSCDEKLPRIEFEDINSGVGTLNKNVYEKDNKDKRGTKFSEGEILFGKLRPYLKNWYLPTFEGIAVGDFWVFSPKSDSNSTYIYFMIQTNRFFHKSNISTGTKMPRTDWSILSSSKFGKPELEEQEK